MNDHLIKRSFQLAGHRTSVALEAEFWAVLETLAARRGQSLSALIANADAERAEAGTPLASTLRVMALRSAQADEQTNAAPASAGK